MTSLKPRFMTIAGVCAAVVLGAIGASAIARKSPKITAEAKPPAKTNTQIGAQCGTDDIFQKLCIDNPQSEPFRFDQVKAPYPDAAGCKSFATSHPDARSCLCDACFSLQQQCDALPACQAMQQCTLDTGCTDLSTCYLDEGLCRDVIDAWGNTGVAAALTLKLGGCGLVNHCIASPTTP